MNQQDVASSLIKHSEQQNFLRQGHKQGFTKLMTYPAVKDFCNWRCCLVVSGCRWSQNQAI